MLMPAPAFGAQYGASLGLGMAQCGRWLSPSQSAGSMNWQKSLWRVQLMALAHNKFSKRICPSYQLMSCGMRLKIFPMATSPVEPACENDLMDAFVQAPPQNAYPFGDAIFDRGLPNLGLSESLGGSFSISPLPKVRTLFWVPS